MALQLGSDVSTVDTEHGTVLLDERSGRYWQLNPTGGRVMRTVLSGGTRADAVSALVAEFVVEQPQAEADVAALLDGLRSAGLLTSS